MLTRLRVSGFKNLEQIDVRFGPFTCIAGPNGVGKSNLFDAIAFLGALADKPLVEAAATVRGTEGRIGDVRALFRTSVGRRAPEMSFVAEMIIPARGEDDLGSVAEASMTFLRYTLRLGLTGDTEGPSGLRVLHEEMEHINKTGAKEALGFPHAPAWRESVIHGRRTVPYIETVEESGRTVVLTRADSSGGQGGGGPRRHLATNLPRTVLSTANSAAEHRTLVLARREMMSWTQFQLEPSALRAPDPFGAPKRLAPNGAHLAATLHALGEASRRSGDGSAEDLYQRVANRLAELYEDVGALHVDVDERRELFSIVLTDLRGTPHPASSLSDGTLRFLALAILEVSPRGPSLLCLEEPENGIHPDRIEAMVGLLRDLAVDVELPTAADNPMRQVIVNTHSPRVVEAVPADTLIAAQSTERARGHLSERTLALSGLPDTWRGDAGASLLPVLPYLSSLGVRPDRHARGGPVRLIDREDIRQLGLFEPRAVSGEPA